MSGQWSIGSGVPDSSSQDGLLPGQRFGPFELLAPLGQGSSSRVFRARGPRGELVALKLLREGATPVQRERFRREGALAAGLRIPGIVPLLAAGEVEGRPYLAHELIEGGPGFLPALAAADLPGRVRLLRDVAVTLAQAHAAGVVHRDLKPANLLIDARGRPWIADFGLALAEGEARLTGTGEVLGTPLYMAPEQLEPGRDPPDPRVDVWAVGVLLYQALTGRLPFQSRSWLELRKELPQLRPTPPQALFPAVPFGLSSACLAALAPLAGRLPAAALAAALDAALPGIPPGPGPVIALDQVGATPGSSGLQRLGRFALRGVLGKGGMGVVYRAWDPELQREVALKLIVAARGTARLERFRREGEVTASLNHPGIVRVHSTGVLEETPFLVYELVPGARTLRQVAPELPRARRLELLRDAARALGFAHERGVVHRDVKPENLLVDAEGRIKVADFGLAAAEGQERITRTGAMVGTPLYMAPELVSGKREQVGPATDVWGLGVVLYELLTGAPPFEGQSLPDLAARILERPAPDPRELDPGLAPELAAICRRALQSEPERRYRDAGELAADLEAHLAGRPLAPATTAAGGRRAAWAAAAGALCLLLAGALLLARGRGAAAPPTAIATLDSGGPAAQVASDRPEDGPVPAWPRLLGSGGQRKARAAFMRDGRLVVWSADGWVRTWDAASGEPRGPERRAAERLELLLPVGDRLLVGADAEGLVWLPAGEALPARPPEEVHSLAVSPDERLVAVGSPRGLRVFEVGSGRLLATPGSFVDPVEALAFSLDGRWLAAAGGPGAQSKGAPFLIVWALPGWEERRLICPATGRVVAWTPGGELVVGTNVGMILIYRPAAEQEPRQLAAREAAQGERGWLGPVAHFGSLRGLAVAPDGRRLWSASWGEDESANELRAWDLESGTERGPPRVRPGRPLSLAISPDGRWLALGTARGQVEVWPAE